IIQSLDVKEINKNEDEIMVPETKKEEKPNIKLQNNNLKTKLMPSSSTIKQNTSLLITPKEPKRISSFSQKQKILNNNIKNNNNNINNSLTISEPDNSKELNISQCSIENNKTKQNKKCYSMPNSATQSMVASTSTTINSLINSQNNDRPKSLLPLQSSKLIRPSTKIINKNNNLNKEKQLITKISTKTNNSITTTNSTTIRDNNLEKKPVLAVKDCCIQSTSDSSLSEQQKRNNRENIAIGVVSPMLKKHDKQLNENIEEKEKDELNKINNENNKIKNNCSSSIQKNLKSFSSTKNTSKIITKKSPSKISLPTTGSTIKKLENKQINKILLKENQKIIKEDEECPQSPLMPPPLELTKLFNNNNKQTLRGEIQGKLLLFIFFYYYLF
ncbi:hypothetical protein Mgra_00005336, partial [Meloidogyne graminicola]